jgi:hypothetical protein
MDLKKLIEEPQFWVWIIFILVLALRLYIVFQTPYFNYDAYYTLRQVDHIKSTGLPLYNDPLSFGGKTQLFAPLHYYVLSLFSFVMPLDIAAKIIPNICAALLVLIVFSIALKVTKHPKISALAAFMSGFLPIMFLNINNVSVEYIGALLMFSIVYCIFRINERKYIDYALILMFVLVLTTPLAFLLVVGLLLYLLLLKLENVYIEMKELEIILFFTFLVFWVNLLIFKNAFLIHGFLVVWQNIPTQILANFFDKITFLEIFIMISIIPLIIGLYSMYIVFQKDKSKEAMLLTAFTIAAFVLTWFKLLDLVTGIVFMSISLVMLASFGMKDIFLFMEKTKFYRYTKLMLAIVIILFIATAIIPSYIIGADRSRITPSTDDIKVLQWASQHVPANATMAASLEEGNIIAYYAKRKNALDTNFLLVPHIDQRLKDMETIYTTQFETEAVRSLNKYHAQYLLVTPWTVNKYHINELSYLYELDCFSRIDYSGNTSLYITTCEVK